MLERSEVSFRRELWGAMPAPGRKRAEPCAKFGVLPIFPLSPAAQLWDNPTKQYLPRRELWTLNDRLLADIGMSRDETTKPFWQALSRRTSLDGAGGR